MTSLEPRRPAATATSPRRSASSRSCSTRRPGARRAVRATIACPTLRRAKRTRASSSSAATPIVRCDDCALVFSNPQVTRRLVLDEYREGGSNDLWVDVLTSPRQLELDRAEVRRDPRRARAVPRRGLAARRGHVDRPLPAPGSSTAAGRARHRVRRRALAYARDELRASTSVDTPIEELDGRIRRRHGPLRARARQRAARVPARRSAPAVEAAAARRT